MFYITRLFEIKQMITTEVNIIRVSIQHWSFRKDLTTKMKWVLLGIKSISKVGTKTINLVDIAKF